MYVLVFSSFLKQFDFDWQNRPMSIAQKLWYDRGENKECGVETPAYLFQRNSAEGLKLKISSRGVIHSRSC